MEPVTIAIIGTMVFGAVTALSIFIRQLLLSRDKMLNDKAQMRALTQETRELEKMRMQMENGRRFDSHYQVLGANKDAIQYLDQKIEEILSKKLALIHRYAEAASKQSLATIQGETPEERKIICDKLRQEVDYEIAFYDKELEQLQARRASIWDSHADLQGYLLEQEKTRNRQLDDIYRRHTSVLEKVYIRHNENSEHVATASIDAGTQAFKLLTQPLQFLLQFFRLSSNITPQKAKEEADSRSEVEDAERDINEGNDYEEDDENNYYASEESASELMT
ncbi:hypothetical protein [Legionella oakridgensis]|uniref:Uncharacterized protein n=2 Tax=Legionella oakridgensis TaxID=29423 RepID=W0BG69_9GAMM|nr:hypothetical protein [Legionella oakridgensis]AHE67429.1 hypothetical protein Loa_01882 [Legionella oakridgensis ATCC 33761 = DSM 21215]ETO92961.1 hypothetical protein LOR_44c06880 [Legionella oakridgensis RV-2-2007]KTD43489.1 hypothetical protein Loak_0664 [Legionella oakridgensis]STY20481.1 Uncharacterised protein [Legionella longbeachae]